MLDKFDPIDPPPPPPAATQRPHLRERGGGWWDVVLPSGRPINDRALRHDLAERLISCPEEFWQPPAIWESCCILGGGPSIKNLDLALLDGHRVLAVNGAYKLGDYEAMIYTDTHWLNDHGRSLRDWPGLKVTTQAEHRGRWDIKLMEYRNRPAGLTREPGRLIGNFSTGGTAINLAVQLGVRRIILLGFDMQLVDGEKNYHDDYGAVPEKTPFKHFLRNFPAIASRLEEWGIECINATPGSALKVFPVAAPEDVL